MIQLNIEELAIAAQGVVDFDLAKKVNLEGLCASELVIDSRAILPGQQNEQIAFLALKGPTFDGHDFVSQVVSNGCSIVIVDHKVQLSDECSDDVVQIIVNDTHQALGLIAAYVKAKVNPKTIGITGSSGKTTLKEMLASILSHLGTVLATNGNFNNDIGVPLTLLRLEKVHDFAVVEMGANHAGEIAYTTELVKPDVAIINNIAAAHLEGFGDLEGVANAKGEIYAGLKESGIAIYNQDSVFNDKWQWRLVDKKVKTVACNTNTAEPIKGNESVRKPDCYSSDVKMDQLGCATFTLHTPLGSREVSLNIPGIHNVCNAVTAACGAISVGASLEYIAKGLSQMGEVAGRLNMHKLGSKINLIDDTYNANVDSVKAATALLANYHSFNILVLGDMGELGNEAKNYHKEVGAYAAKQEINALFTLGTLSQEASNGFVEKNEMLGKSSITAHFKERKELLNMLCLLIEQQSKKLNNNKTPTKSISILVKGSRSAHMERVVEDIISWQEQLHETKGQQKEDNT
ncbi:MAG: UDP-N-acetylmuramoyl-tripeptide--D-alanyl-D-alanine ligase [Colwellia sp.]